MHISVKKTKNNEFIYIQQSFRTSAGKTSSKIFRSLGTVDDLKDQLKTDRAGVLAWARKEAEKDTEEFKSENEKVTISLLPNIPIKKDCEREFNCGYLFLQSICSSLRFDNIVRNIKAKHKFEYDLEAILSDLVYARVLEPSSKANSYDYCRKLLESPKYELHDVYRALSVLAGSSDYIQSEVYQNSQFLHKRKTDVLYYDCTNYYFEIEQEDEFRKYGKSKENRPNPIVGMGLFMDKEGFPLAFGLHPGNMNEQLTLQPLEKKVISDFNCSEFIYCSDSGLGSAKNKLFNDMGNRSYVITQSLKKLKAETRSAALDPAQYRRVGSKAFIDLRDLDESDPAVFDSIYYKEIPVESKAISETMIVTYSPKYKKYQRTIRDNQIQRAEHMIDSKGSLKSSRRNPNDPARFLKKTAVTENGEAAGHTFCEIDEEKIAQEEMYDGFYAVVTDIEGDVNQIIEINKRRWQIEECFRIMKTDFNARPVYLSRQDRIEAHFLICFLSLLVYRMLEAKLDKKYTAEQIIDTLRGMNTLAVEGYGYIPAYKRTDLTDKLHELFGFHTDRQIITKKTMRNIIKKSKNK